MFVLFKELTIDIQYYNFQMSIILFYCYSTLFTEILVDKFSENVDVIYINLSTFVIYKNGPSIKHC